MRKSIKHFRLVIVIIAILSITNFYGQSNEYPPIQNFFDKIKERKMEGEEPMKISQKITGNTFTFITDWYNIIDKDYYENIDWEDFSHVQYSDSGEKYIKCNFTFYANLKLTTGTDEKSVSETDYFKCYILTSDKAKMVEIIEKWQNSK